MQLLLQFIWIFSFLNATIFFTLILTVTEGIYYWNFSKPAYSVADFLDGYEMILNNVSADQPTQQSVEVPSATVAFAQNFAPTTADQTGGTVNEQDAESEDRKNLEVSEETDKTDGSNTDEL